MMMICGGGDEGDDDYFVVVITEYWAKVVKVVHPYSRPILLLG